MATQSWPTLSRDPVSCRMVKADNTIRTPLADGKLLTMSRATSQLQTIAIRYAGLTDADYDTLSAFEDTQGIGAELIILTHPRRGTTHYVVLAAPISFTLSEETHLWQAECRFTETGDTA